MMGRPMLPTAAVLSPAAVRIDSSIWVVVVLPFVPVTREPRRDRCRVRLSRQASSTSLQMATPRAAACASSGELAGQPVAMTQVGIVGKRSRSNPAPAGPCRRAPPAARPCRQVRSSRRVVQSRDTGAEME